MVKVENLVSQLKAKRFLPINFLVFRFVKISHWHLAELNCYNIVPSLVVGRSVDMCCKAADNIYRLADISTAIGELENIDSTSLATN